MDRRRYPQRQYVPPGMVDFGQIDFGHDVVAQQMPGILQNYQQRWDMQDAAIAKLLEEQAGTQMLEGDAQAVGNLLKGSFDEIDTLVKDKYQGDRGAAAMDIVKRLSAARTPLAQARAEKESYDKAFDKYERLAEQGRAPQTFITDDKGNIAPKTLGFEEFYSDTARPAFDEKGKYVPRTYGTLRGASDLSGYLAQNVSKALNAESEQSGLLDNQTAGYLFQLTESGTSPQQIEEQIFKNKATGELTTYGKELAQQLRGEVDFLQDELGTNASDEQLMRYATPIIQGQVAQQLDRRYIQDGRNKDGDGTGNENFNLFNRRLQQGLNIDRTTDEVNKTFTSLSEGIDSILSSGQAIQASANADNTLGTLGITTMTPEGTPDYDYKRMNHILTLPDESQEKQVLYESLAKNILPHMDVLADAYTGISPGETRNNRNLLKKLRVGINEDTGLYEAFIETTSGQPTHVDLKKVLWITANEISTEKFQKALEKKIEKQAEKNRKIIENNPTVRHIASNYPEIGTEQLLQDVQEYSTKASQYYNMNYIIGEPNAQSNMLEALSSFDFGKEGVNIPVEHSKKNTFSSTYKTKSEKRGGDMLLRDAIAKRGNKRVSNIEVDPRKGNIVVNIDDKGINKRVPIPFKALYEGSSDVLKELSRVLEEFYGLGASSGEGVLAGIPLEYSKEYNSEGEIEPIMLVKGTNQRIDPNWLVNQVVNQFVLGTGQTVKIEPHKIK